MSADGVNRNWRNNQFLYLVGNHNKLATVAPNSNNATRFRVTIPFARMTNDLLQQVQIEATQLRTMLEVFCPSDG